MIAPEADVASNLSALFPSFVAPKRKAQPLRATTGQIDSRAAYKGMGMLDSEVLIVLRKGTE